MGLFAKNNVASDNSDELLQLIRRLQRGEQAALGRLYDLTLPKVYGLVLRIVRTPADAEEVTCDVFHEIWRLAKQFDSKRGNPSQWIMVIARSRALDRYRQRQQYRHEVHLNEEVNSYAPTETSDACSLLQEFETGSAVQIAIAALGSVQAELVKLAFFHGLTHQEIAAFKQLPLGTVKSHLKRASTALRKNLAATDLR